jgi:predicted alpha/beta-fold hydrolase
LSSGIPNAETQREELFARTKEAFARKPFKPHPLFTSGDAQTLAAYAWPRPYRFGQPLADEARLFEVEPGIRILTHCRWQTNPTDHATVIVWHGMEGSTSSIYMIAMADKAFRSGFNVVRVNFRNCGNTEHLTPTLYYGGLTGDPRFVINELIEKDGLKRLLLIGFSLGGNVLLKLVGEYGPDYPEEVLACCAISPSVDLRASTDHIQLRRNWLYHRSFLRRVKRKIRIKHQLYPDLYDITNLKAVRSIRAFDDRYTSIAAGFANADEYYYASSSLRVAQHIRIPTLIIHAKDDPFIPYRSVCDEALQSNPNVLTEAPEKGGHVAFVGSGYPGEDRFWAENRAIEFCELATSSLSS